MNNIFDATFIIALIGAAIRMSVPLLYATIGEIVSERSGVMNIGIEGQMLSGAFAAFVISNMTGNVYIGILCAGIVGSITSLTVAFLGVSRNQDQSVIGIIFNLLIVGLTSYLYRLFFGSTATPPTVPILENISVPILSKIPILGPALFEHTILTYIVFVLAIATWFIIFHTKFGLLLQTVGENPRAAQANGVSVVRMRYIAVIFCGFMAGVGGAFLTIGVVGRFMENISSGRGFIALAITILVRWNPLYAIFGAFGFGLIDAMQLRVQALGIAIPYQFMVMMPYAVTLLSLMFLGRNINAPRALGLPYEKEGR